MNYTLFQILLFFDSEESKNFSTIKHILAIIDSKAIRTEDKQDLIMRALREASFYDIEYIKTLSPEMKEQIIKEYLKHSQEFYNKLCYGKA